MEELLKFLNDNSSAFFSLLTLFLTSVLAGVSWCVKQHFVRKKTKNKMLFEKALELSSVLIEIEKKYFKSISSWTEISNCNEKGKSIDIKFGYNKIEDCKTLVIIFFPEFKKEFSEKIDILFNFLFAVDNKQAFHNNELNPINEMKLTLLRNAAQKSLAEAIELFAYQIRNRYYDH